MMTTTESRIEHDLIAKLEDLKYIHRPDIRDRAALEANFRQKFEELNRVKLTDNEFERLLGEVVTADVFTASRTLRSINSIEREDGTPLNYTLVNTRDWCKNHFEVVNQLRINTDNSYHRYDVILLINGAPVVQIELKNLAVSPRRAMQQIVEYKSDPGNGYGKTLLCFIQLFIVSNRTDTWYFANNNGNHFNFNADERFQPVYQFADKDNKKITHLEPFADAFLAKCTLASMISRYMVLVACEKQLMMMRPYQIYAVQNIVECISKNHGDGYIWHTTGSGKTLTSFKASTLLKENPEIDKCLFVVDRKDLDRQTREEFNRFQQGCVEQNTNTEALVNRMLSDDHADKVIVTTIQKLGLALSSPSADNADGKDGDKEGNQRKESKKLKELKERLKPLRNQRMVFIFDECHRSQFGDNHKAIKDFFPQARLFGFTGTPIFGENAIYKQIEGQQASLRTTEDLFQRCLHQYTITHAIEDRNVLRFHVAYYKAEGKQQPQPGEALAKRKVIEAILAKHDAATAGRKFNALLATARINDAIEYYNLFQTVQDEMQQRDPDFHRLNIACVFSPPTQELAKDGDSQARKNAADVRQLQEDLPQEKQDNQQNPEEKKAALTAIIDDYNNRYGSNHRISEFDLYYQDVQKRIKDQQYPNAALPRSQKIDITIVVDMLLTGFDSRFLNTLYVDKKLRYHGLIQAFSRTNRVLDDSKPYGNILDFRQQRNEVEQAIAHFSGEQTDNPREIWLVEPAAEVLERYETAVAGMAHFMEKKNLACEPAQVYNLKGDDARVEFVNRFKEVQRLKTQLDQYTDLEPAQKTRMEDILPQDQLQSFRSTYLETAKRLKEQQTKQGDQAPEEVQQLDFEFVLFASTLIDYDYIMGLIARMSGQAPGKSTMNREQLIRLIEADAKFIDEREDIAEYIRSLPLNEALDEQEIRAGYDRFKTEKKTRQLKEIAAKHQLDAAALQTFTDETLRRRIFDGEQLSDLFASQQLGWKARTQAELALMADLTPLLHKWSQGREISGLSAYE